jgi:hypothetical protein
MPPEHDDRGVVGNEGLGAEAIRESVRALTLQLESQYEVDSS